MLSSLQTWMRLGVHLSREKEREIMRMLQQSTRATGSDLQDIDLDRLFEKPVSVPVPGSSPSLAWFCRYCPGARRRKPLADHSFGEFSSYVRDYICGRKLLPAAYILKAALHWWLETWPNVPLLTIFAHPRLEAALRPILVKLVLDARVPLKTAAQLCPAETSDLARRQQVVAKARALTWKRWTQLFQFTTGLALFVPGRSVTIVGLHKEAKSRTIVCSQNTFLRPNFAEDGCSIDKWTLSSADKSIRMRVCVRMHPKLLEHLEDKFSSTKDLVRLVVQFHGP